MARRFVPRWYQSASVDAMNAYLHESDGHGLVVLPTGSGKSFTQVEFCKQQVKELGDVRICLLAHQKELISQTFRSMISAWPQAPIGIYSAGLNMKRGRAQIVVAGIQSIYNKSGSTGGFDILILDECQLLPKKAGGMYERFITDQMRINPHLRVFGLTATPYRLDSGRLDEGEPRLFTEIIFEVSIATLMEQGFLATPITKLTHYQIDLSKVKKSGSDYDRTQLAAATDQAEVTKAAVAEIIARCGDRKKWLIFGASVDHCYHIAEELALYQISACVVHGDLDHGERDRLLREHREGKYKVIINYGLLTTGYDDPEIDLIALLRGTASMGLYYQMVGRGFRPIYPKGFDTTECTHEERFAALMEGPKPNFLVLDFAGNIKRHGPLDDLLEKASKKNKRKKTISSAPMKVCRECETVVSVSTRTCPDCGFEWEVEESTKHETAPDEESAILKKDEPKQLVSSVQWAPVRSVVFRIHSREGKLDSLRITWETDHKAKSVSQWLVFGGQEWRWTSLWEKLTGGKPQPRNAKEALDILMVESVDISHIAIERARDSKYWELRGHRVGQGRDTARYYNCPQDDIICAQGDVCPCTRGLRYEKPKVEAWASDIEGWDGDDIPF